jgi:hypothetical protein
MDTAINKNLRIHCLKKLKGWLPNCVVVACQQWPDFKNGLHQSLPLNTLIDSNQQIHFRNIDINILLYSYTRVDKYGICRASCTLLSMSDRLGTLFNKVLCCVNSKGQSRMQDLNKTTRNFSMEAGAPE